MQDIPGRVRRIPIIVYPQDLPIAASRVEIARAIASHVLLQEVAHIRALQQDCEHTVVEAVG